MRLARFVLPFALVLSVVACDRPTPPADAAKAPAAPPARAFSYAGTSDLSGYYLPTTEVRLGKWGFNHVFVGQASEFSAWTGTDAEAVFAPVMLQFDDVTSPMVQNELGEARSVTARVLPTRYTVSDDRIEFEGVSTQLGEVRFVGHLDPGALATSRRNLGDEGVVVTGTLTAAGQTVRDVRLRWWMGD